MTEKEKAKVNEIMRLLDCTEEEAIDVIETDKIIDKGGRTKYDFDKEKEKVAMKISAVNDRRAKDKENNQRGKVRAENPTKENIIAELSQFLAENSQNGVENVEIVNKSKLITFQIGEKSFKLDLIEQRKKKN